MRKLATLAVNSVLLWTVSSASVLANPITVTGAFHNLDNRSANSVNISAGLVQQFGAFAVPNGFAGTSGVASQAGTPNVPLANVGFSSLPNFFGAGRFAANVPDGDWTLTFTNNVNTPNTTVVTTPDIAGAVPLGFAQNVSISGSGNTPTFNWAMPPGTPPEAVRVLIWDLKTVLGVGNAGIGNAGVADIILDKGLLPNATSVTINPGDPAFAPGKALLPNHLYSLEVLLRDLRNPAGPNNPANTLSESLSFFDFVLLPAGAPAEVFIPIVDRTNPTAPVYTFTPIGVAPGVKIFIDPLVAVGYDYQTAPGNPNFASVTLPTGVGDNLFDLFLWDGSQFIDSGSDLTGGVEFLFAAGGVNRFRILGIEIAAGLDPDNVTAFITGLTFTAAGTFSGTMTPIAVFVPEPGAVSLLLAGLAGLLLSRRRATG